MAQHIHILGICGTFMGGIAALARDMGLKVTGWDAHVYPPMSTQLENLGIDVTDSLDPQQFETPPDLVIVGNAMSRGHPLVEWLLEQNIPFLSGPEWLGKALLRDKHVLAVAGTHGKTTTASMLVNILEAAGLNPGFLVGGVVRPFNLTARNTESRYFVIEADEYDTAFFDKRSKFVHYYPDTFVINNLEFDHADIFPDLAAIQRQFAHALRLVPSSGHVIVPEQDNAIAQVLEQGVWSEVYPVGAQEHLHVEDSSAAGEKFTLVETTNKQQVTWPLLGEHNVKNALMATAAARKVGVSLEQAAEALQSFAAPARRMEVRAKYPWVTLYDDFAHHPTAIATTLSGLRHKVGEDERIIAIFEPRSNTMKAGVHQGKLASALAEADEVYVLQPEGAQWLENEAQLASNGWHLFSDLATLVTDLTENCTPHSKTAKAHWLVMSNGGFGGIHEKLIAFLNEAYGEYNEV
ncbi:UDP-N-acetylmuramate:L-alanyl-gamma-D-glutamyl-meso-diaminopimelate ligase [Aliidiomarina sp. B3213]|uniref:UDP-N-acetylmuramate:L-alanyl-gamma-D-glutamyl- meso-diaminopimelate ligase n=1 Tax=Aliidiomarina sp. B3213 TaxID=2249757 RepID=UPI002110B14C|nr:UDP-N-acetylmuramate:L-alanyl-gamma-D-glutamyl-meso-diaminopimelate ligase [Aliidiomarina sp. B3213]